jgi:ABC-type glycerol-3-phosphate transport system substrate-binding protein
MKNIGLQNIITGVFIFVAVVALLVFAGVINVGGDSEQAQGEVTVWGTIPFSVMQKYIDQTVTSDLRVNYQVQDVATYESDLVNAIAAGRGPDLFIMPHEQILRNKDKVFEVPYGNFPRRDFTRRYIRASELFLTETGVMALPVAVDPLVMYYNKNLMDSAFVLDVPEFWDQVLPFTESISVSDANGRVSISGAALGTYENVNHAKSIISALMIQNGNRFVDTDPSSGKYRSTLALNQDKSLESQQTLQYYTSFSNINNANYSWNEALPTSTDMFIAGDLALYFGPASELTDIRRKNPNLDFDVALLPQLSERSNKSTFGSLTGIAISKQSPNIAGALQVASALTGPDIAGALSAEINQIPARVDLLRDRPDEAYLTLFYNSAIISDAWIDPSFNATSDLMRSMVRNINTGALSVSESISRSHVDLNTILEDTINTTVVDRNLEVFEG